MTGPSTAPPNCPPPRPAAEVDRRLRAAGVALRIEDGALRYTAPPGALTEELRAEVRACRDDLLALVAGRQQEWTFTADPAAAGEPFPLTDLQQAYLVGEQDFYGRPTPAVLIHEYAFAPADAPAPERLEAALGLLVRTHPALRLAVDPDGTQRVLPAAEEHGGPLDRHDLRGRTDDEAAETSAALRAALVRDLPPLGAGQPFLLRHITLPEGAVRLQIAMRLIAFDAVTTQLFLDALARCCADPGHRPQAPRLGFRDYVTGLRRREHTEAHRQARRHWEERLDKLPGEPALPQAGTGQRPGADAAPAQQAELRRLTTRLPAADWDRLRARAAEAGLPPGTVLLALYVEALQRWSEGGAGLITVLARHRPGDHPELPAVWGNASTTLLLGYPAAEATSFAERCRALQQRLYADLAAIEVSGIEVGRTLRTAGAAVGNPAAVVFTSGLDRVDGAPGGFLLPLPGARLVHSAVSTPQVLLDHQVYEEDGDLVCNFDHSETAYPAGLIAELRGYHRARLAELADGTDAWHRPGPVELPVPQLADRRTANDTGTPLPTGELHAFVLDRLRADPAAPAVLDADGTASRAELDAGSAALARRLKALGVGRTAGRPEPVAVRAPKGRRQSVAVLGVLRAGGAYLPVDPGWPAARIRTVLAHSGAVALVGDEWPDTAAALPDGVPLVPLAADPGPGPGMATTDVAGDPDGTGGPADRTAYVIYTSGSTGTPKGVVIRHDAAVNTLQDLTARFALGPADRVLAVSSLAFDLSVFDQFALLGAGGTVVAPPESEVPDPQAWADCVHRHGVTVWNSVPALLELTLEYLGEQAAELLAPLRLVMLSGDWVPLSLIDRLAKVCPDARVVAMGGATEASIWSNWHEVDGVPADWTSIPYGRPLANQTMHVLDASLADAPTWVPGDLYIGGAGLAAGYLGDPERTDAAFPVHPRSGERLYRTGDRARYRPGGVLEFLGRADHQVKINGFRVELGEIEAQLTAQDGIEAAVALVDASRADPLLAAFVTRAGGCGDTVGRAPDEALLRERLAERLPHYMVPAIVVELAALPLSANGKVDRKALTALLGPAATVGTAGGADEDGPADGPATAEEARLLEIWRELLGPAVTRPGDDFFRLGGNSLTAVRLFHRIEAAFGRRLPLASLFRAGTVRAQARLLAASTPAGEENGPLVALGGAGGQHVVLVHPVGGDVLCYRETVDLLGAVPATVHGLRARGLRPGEQPAASLPAMAEDYADAVLAALPDGPLHLVGWSMGGTVALRLAGALARRGRTVSSLTAIDAFTGAGRPSCLGEDERLRAFFNDLTAGALAAADGLPGSGLPTGGFGGSPAAAQRELVAAGVVREALAEAELTRLFGVYRAHSVALERHVAEAGAVDTLLVRAVRTGPDGFPGLVPLDVAAPGAGRVLEVDEDHYSVVRGAGARLVADRIAAVVADAGAVVGNEER